MQIAYFSVTGRVRAFVDQLDYDSYEILPADPFYEMDEPYVLILPTYDLEYFEAVEAFLDHQQNQTLLKGIAGSGNKNFGDDYVFIAEEFASAYGVPLIYQFEHSGTPQDIAAFERKIAPRTGAALQVTTRGQTASDPL